MTSSRRALFILPLAIIAAYIVRAQIFLLMRLLLGGIAIAYVFFPISQLLTRRFHLGRTASIIGSFSLAAAILVLFGVLFLPSLLRQMKELLLMMPYFAERIRLQLQAFNTQLVRLGMSRLALPSINWENVFSSLPPLLGGTASFAGSLLSRFTEWTISFMLGYYFLRDRERLTLHLEMLIPASLRRTTLKMTAAVHQEISTFFRGQFVISLCVAALSALGLMLAGVRSFLALGLIAGIFNMIPYFGPLLGGIPAVLTALTQGIGTALFAAFALLAVQQLDSMIISPRIMGALTGLHPGSVLLAITIGGSFGGVLGMLLAIPLTLAIRAISRVWICRKPS